MSAAASARLLWLVEFHLRSVWNWRTMHVGRLLEPVLYYGLLVAGLTGLSPTVSLGGHRISYGYFALPGAIGILAVRTWATTIVDFANDRKWGVYALSRVGGTSWAIFAISTLLGQLVQVALQLVLLLGAAVLLSSDLIASGTLMMTMLSIVVVTFWVMLGIALGSVIHSYHGRDLAVSLGVLPIAFTAPLLYPLAAAPTFLQIISVVNLLRYQVEMLRGAATGSCRTARS